MPKTLSTLQASVASLFIAAVAQVVAYVPNLAPLHSDILSVGGFVIAGVFALVHAGKDIATGVTDAKTDKIKLTFSDIEDDVKAAAEDAASHIKTINPADVEALVEKVLSGKEKVPSLSDIEHTVESELQKLLSGAQLNVTVPAPAVEAVVVPDSPVVVPDPAPVAPVAPVA